MDRQDSNSLGRRHLVAEGGRLCFGDDLLAGRGQQRGKPGEPRRDRDHRRGRQLDDPWHCPAGRRAGGGPLPRRGVTWGDRQQFDNTGWLNSISCATTENCWAAGSGTTVSLVGTADAGKSWASVTSDTSNQDGSVSCLSVNVCVATTDNGCG